MPKIEVHRKNCIYGVWGVPDDTNGPDWVDAVSMMTHYISDQEGRTVSADELRKLDFSFNPDNKADAGGHGVMGNVQIVYELKKK